MFAKRRSHRSEAALAFMREHGVRNPSDAVYQAMANAFNLELLKDGLATHK